MLVFPLNILHVVFEQAIEFGEIYKFSRLINPGGSIEVIYLTQRTLTDLLFLVFFAKINFLVLSAEILFWGLSWH